MNKFSIFACSVASTCLLALGAQAQQAKTFNTGYNMFISGEAVFMKRSGVDSRTLLTNDAGDPDNPSTAPVVLKSGDLNDGYRPGARFAGGLRLRPGLWLVADVLFIRWSDTSSYNSGDNDGNDNNEVNFPWTNRDWPSESDGADSTRVEYKSTLWTVGLKVKSQRNKWLSVFAGPRFYRLSETLDMRACDADGSACPLNGRQSGYAQYNVSTSNNLVGGEIGATAKFRIVRRLFVSLTGTVGAFGNVVSSNQFLQDNGNVARDDGKSKTAFSFVGTARLRLSYRVTHRFTVFAGYEMMYITGLATAPSQLDFNLKPEQPPASSTSLRTNDSVIFHGGVAGIKFHW